MNGVVIIDKPQGKTSHDVVASMRRIFGTRRVGHTGTLDPLATGVLPICVGNATKAADMLVESDKHYTAVFELGKRTDTLDIDGHVTAVSEVKVTETQLAETVASFVGEQMQIPPMYSAIKKNGKKLYELARMGMEVEREARAVEIYSIALLETNLPFAKIDVHCSKGTYIRSLCDDIGSRLGCGAVMTELRRTSAAGFEIEEAHTIEELEQCESPEALLRSTDSLFADLPEIHLNEKQEKSIVNGVRMTWRSGSDGEKYRVYGANGKFLCISQLKESKLHLVKSFWT